MRDMSDKGTWRGNPGDGSDLGSRSRTSRKRSAETGGGSRRVEVASRWIVATRPGELGGISV